MTKKRLILLLIPLLLFLSGCRTRTLPTASRPAGNPGTSEPAFPEPTDGPDLLTEDPEGVSRENPESRRREYDDNADADLLEEQPKTVQTQGEGEEGFSETPDGNRQVDTIREDADRTATRTVSAETAERLGISDDAPEAASAQLYFSVLLQERLDTLFECKRLNAYWETVGDHVTVFRTGPEHALILRAGLYDVSARLLEENLMVDDGWIGRKNPDLIVKIVSGAFEQQASTLLSRPGWESFQAVKEKRVILFSEEMFTTPCRQTAAVLQIACLAYPDLFSDLDLSAALQMLADQDGGNWPDPACLIPLR